jgi:ComF family protein
LVGINFLKTVTDFFFPEHCVICDDPLSGAEEIVCNVCLNHLPFTEMPFDNDNPVSRIFKPSFDIYKATALMFYRPEGASGKLIRELKYNNRPEIGKLTATYLAPKLSADAPDIIIPVPLHKKKLKIRGYNQLEYFGKELARKLDAEYRDDILIKTKHTETQTKKSPMERWQNVMKTFHISNTEILKNKHVLLIDDVLTTGATLSAAASVLLQAEPSVKISVAVMAVRRD